MFDENKLPATNYSAQSSGQSADSDRAASLVVTSDQSLRCKVTPVRRARAQHPLHSVAFALATTLMLHWRAGKLDQQNQEKLVALLTAGLDPVSNLAELQQFHLADLALMIAYKIQAALQLTPEQIATHRLTAKHWESVTQRLFVCQVQVLSQQQSRTKCYGQPGVAVVIPVFQASDDSFSAWLTEAVFSPSDQGSPEELKKLVLGLSTYVEELNANKGAVTYAAAPHAGAGFAPLSGLYPQARRSYVLEDAKVVTSGNRNFCLYRSVALGILNYLRTPGANTQALKAKLESMLNQHALRLDSLLPVGVTFPDAWERFIEADTIVTHELLATLLAEAVATRSADGLAGRAEMDKLSKEFGIRVLLFTKASASDSRVTQIADGHEGDSVTAASQMLLTLDVYHDGLHFSLLCDDGLFYLSPDKNKRAFNRVMEEHCGEINKFSADECWLFIQRKAKEIFVQRSFAAPAPPSSHSHAHSHTQAQMPSGAMPPATFITSLTPEQYNAFTALVARHRGKVTEDGAGKVTINFTDAEHVRTFKTEIKDKYTQQASTWQHIALFPENQRDKQTGLAFTFSTRVQAQAWIGIWNKFPAVGEDASVTALDGSMANRDDFSLPAEEREKFYALVAAHGGIFQEEGDGVIKIKFSATEGVRTFRNNISDACNVVDQVTVGSQRSETFGLIFPEELRLPGEGNAFIFSSVVQREAWSRVCNSITLPESKVTAEAMRLPSVTPVPEEVLASPAATRLESRQPQPKVASWSCCSFWKACFGGRSDHQLLEEDVTSIELTSQQRPL